MAICMNIAKKEIHQLIANFQKKVVKPKIIIMNLLTYFGVLLVIYQLRLNNNYMNSNETSYRHTGACHVDDVILSRQRRRAQPVNAQEADERLGARQVHVEQRSHALYASRGLSKDNS